MAVLTGCAKQAPESQVSEQIKRLNAAIDRLNDRVAALHSRLAPVLQDSPNGLAEDRPSPFLVPLAAEISNCADRLHLHVDSISSLIERCEL